MNIYYIKRQFRVLSMYLHINWISLTTIVYHIYISIRISLCLDIASPQNILGVTTEFALKNNIAHAQTIKKFFLKMWTICSKVENQNVGDVIVTADISKTALANKKKKMLLKFHLLEVRNKQGLLSFITSERFFFFSNEVHRGYLL